MSELDEATALAVLRGRGKDRSWRWSVPLWCLVVAVAVPGGVDAWRDGQRGVQIVLPAFALAVYSCAVVLLLRERRRRAGVVDRTDHLVPMTVAPESSTTLHRLVGADGLCWEVARGSAPMREGEQVWLTPPVEGRPCLLVVPGRDAPRVAYAPAGPRRV